MKKLQQFLSQPYPFYFQGKSLWIITGLLFFMTLFFGYLFKPFDVYVPEHKMNYFWISLIHAVIPIVVILLFLIITIPANIEENWTIKKEFVLISVFLLLIGIAQFLIRDIIYDNPNNWSWPYLYEEIRNTFLSGSLFSFILISLNFNRLNIKNNRNAHIINSSNGFQSTIVSEKTQIDNSILDFNIENFIFAKSEGNYVELFFDDTTKSLKRITIKELELSLNPYSNILKTHRSYLVNINQIENIAGNAQGYKLKLKNHTDKIPVSRNMIVVFNAKMKNI